MKTKDCLIWAVLVKWSKAVKLIWEGDVLSELSGRRRKLWEEAGRGTRVTIYYAITVPYCAITITYYIMLHTIPYCAITIPYFIMLPTIPYCIIYYHRMYLKYIRILDICHFVYTHTFWGLKILHSKARKFTTKKASRQNNVNLRHKLPRVNYHHREQINIFTNIYTQCVKLHTVCKNTHCVKN